MSLNWSIADVKDYETVCLDENGDLKHRTKLLIWATLGTGIGTITEKNWLKFYTRIRAVEAIGGKFGNEHITKDEVKAHIGLKTNVSTDSDSQFAKKLVKLAGYN